MNVNFTGKDSAAGGSDSLVIVRAIEPRDAPAVTLLIPAARLQPPRSGSLARWIEDFGSIGPRQAVFVACLCDEVIGWIEISIQHRLRSAPYALIGGLVVKEGFRGEKVGLRLCLTAEAWSWQLALSSVRVTSRSTRIDAHRFYLKRWISNLPRCHKCSKSVVIDNPKPSNRSGTSPQKSNGPGIEIRASVMIASRLKLWWRLLSLPMGKQALAYSYSEPAAARFPVAFRPCSVALPRSSSCRSDAFCRRWSWPSFSSWLVVLPPRPRGPACAWRSATSAASGAAGAGSSCGPFGFGCFGALARSLYRVFFSGFALLSRGLSGSVHWRQPVSRTCVFGLA